MEQFGCKIHIVAASQSSYSQSLRGRRRTLNTCDSRNPLHVDPAEKERATSVMVIPADSVSVSRMASRWVNHRLPDNSQYLKWIPSLTTRGCSTESSTITITAPRLLCSTAAPHSVHLLHGSRAASRDIGLSYAGDNFDYCRH